jgi:uncharacterized membrane protein YphA (DoxX/SURF4 family)
VVLAAVFAVAGVAKLRDPSGTLRDFEGLGLPRARVLVVFVPVVELSVAALLVIVPAAGALGALVTLAFFTTFLVGRLRAGVTAPCACFGSARRDPLSGVEIARNLALVALAVVALATDRPVRPTLLDVVVVLAPVLVAAVVLGGVRRRRRARAADAGPTAGPTPGPGATSR